MNRKFLIQELKRLQKLKDTEQAHSSADVLLLNFINDDEITNEFVKIDRWYA